MYIEYQVHLAAGPCPCAGLSIAIWGVICVLWNAGHLDGQFDGPDDQKLVRHGQWTYAHEAFDRRWEGVVRIDAETRG